MPKKPQLLHATVVAQTHVFKVEQLDLRFSNGVEVQYERLIGSRDGAVLIIPMVDEQTVLLVREYAAGGADYQLMLPKGRIERDEPPLDAANREMMEEIGYGAHQLTHLTTLTQAPSYQTHTTHIILAEQLYPQKEQGDEPEPLEVVPWRLDNLPALFATGEFNEARSVAAIYMVRERMLTAQGAV